MENKDSQTDPSETILLTREQIHKYREQGYLVLENVLSEAEMAEIDLWFDYFIKGNHEGMGRDLCDMSQPKDTPFENYRLVNAMLPSRYEPKLDKSQFECLAKSISEQLYGGDGIEKDYDQFLAKKPHHEGACFAMHQDLGYWPKTESTWTATFSLALSDSDVENGCLQVVPGSNKEPILRTHLPTALNASQIENLDEHNDFSTLSIQLSDEDEIVFLPVKRGSMTIHDERIVHGSGGNVSDIWRKTYVMAFREKDTIAYERSIGFTHSHNDDLDWKQALS
jgi:ectoine hydroxylase-related dioxygenase (phytanoyl-CoA dioxygenase family)